MIEFIIAVVFPWTISFCLIILLLVSMVILPSLLKSFHKLHWLTKVALLICVTAGMYIRLMHVPNTHRIYFDEDRYLSYAVTFAKYGEARSIKYADEKTLIGDPDQAVRLTIPVMSAWTFKLFGYSEMNVFLLSKFISGLAIILIFILSYILFRSQIASVFAATGMAFLPNIVFWSPSINLDPYFVFFSLLTCVAASYYALSPRISSKTLLLTSLFLLLCVRLEAFVFVPIVFAIVFFIGKDSQPKHFFRKEWVYFVILGIVILARAGVSASVLGKQWCCAEALPIEAFHLSYLARNILPNFFNLFNRPEFPWFITLFALVTSIQQKNHLVSIIGFWFLSFFGLYSVYYAGMFYSSEFSGSYGRYFLILTPPILILAGLSLDSFVKYLQRCSVGRKFFYSSLVIAVVIFSSYTAYKNYKTLITKSPYYAAVDEGPAFVHENSERYFLPNTPKDAIVLTSVASIALMNGRATSLFGLFIEDLEIQELILKKMRNGTKVFSALSLQCEFTPQSCAKITKKVEFKPVETTKIKHPQGLQFLEITLRE